MNLLYLIFFGNTERFFVSFLILIPAVKLVLCGNKQLIASVITSSTVDGLMASLSLTEMSLLWDWLQSS